VDEELERLKRRKLLELQQRMLKHSQEKPKKEETKKLSPKEVLDGCFGERAWEVYDAAWSQFPQVMPHIEKILVEAITSGRVRQRIDGESLYHFLREIGMPVHLQTTIRFKEHGELKTLEQKIREKK
jgi:DNA-binding TFAR19-related protein (PDSD5 family)